MILFSHRKRILISATVSLTIAAFIVACIPGGTAAGLNSPGFDLAALGHVLGFAILCGTLYLTIRELGIKPRHAIILSYSYGLFMAIATESAQLFVPGRNFSLVDILTDMLGTAIGVGLSIKCDSLLRKELQGAEKS